MAEQTATVGRIVHFVLGSGDVRPAVVVRVWPGSLNLRVFLDGTNDTELRGGLTALDVRSDAGVAPICTPDGWATSVEYREPVEGAKLEPGTWFWPPRTP